MKAIPDRARDILSGIDIAVPVVDTDRVPESGGFSFRIAVERGVLAR
jgi:hypothetical protein